LLPTATKVWCGVFKDIKSKAVVKFGPDEIEKMLKYMDKVDVLIMHNGIGYDWPLLEKLHGYVYKGKKVDTLLMSRLQKPDRMLPFNMPSKGKRVGPHSVAAWGYRVGRGKPDHEDWSQYSDEMLHRCSEDVEIQHLVYEELLREAKGLGWRNAHLLTFDLFTILQKQEQYGWLVDQPHMHKSISMLSHMIDRIDRIVIPKLPMVVEIEESKVRGEVGYIKKPFLKSGQYSAATLNWILYISKSSYEAYRLEEFEEPEDRFVMGPFCRVKFRQVDLNSNKECTAHLLAEGWIPDEWNYKKAGKKLVKVKGQLVKTSPKLSQKDKFIGVEGLTGRLIARRIQCRHRRSNIEGWLKNVRADGRISGRVSGIAATGRAKHAGIVNVPGGEAFFGKMMRKAFICKEGFKVVGTDSAGCQNRMLAARVGDDNFTKILLEGNKEDKTSIHFVNQRAIKKIAGYDVTYGNSKNLNYAFMFGASDNKLGSIIGEGKDAGTKMREALLSVSPGFAALVEALTEEWKSNAQTRMNDWGKPEFYNGWIKGLDGRPIWIASEHMILVYMLQSDEAIMMARAYVMLYERATERGWKWGKDWAYLVWMHDEVQCEVREDLAEEFASVAEQCITDAGEYYNIACRHEGESDIGLTWFDTH